MALTVNGAKSLRPAPGLGTHSHALIKFREAAAQTFLKGCPVVFTTGGASVEEDTSDPAPIVGVADHNASGTTGNDVLVVPATPSYIFEGILGNGDLTDYTLAASSADVGDVYGLARDATNLGWFVDKQDTTNVRVRVVGLKDPAGTVNGRVYFTFLTVAVIGGVTTPISALSAA